MKKIVTSAYLPLWQFIIYNEIVKRVKKLVYPFQKTILPSLVDRLE